MVGCAGAEGFFGVALFVGSVRQGGLGRKTEWNGTYEFVDEKAE